MKTEVSDKSPKSSASSQTNSINAGGDGDLPTRQKETAADRDRLDAETPSDISSYWRLLKKTVFELIWPDLILSHLDIASLKTVFRSWVMMWALTLLCICDQTAEFMGPSSFLANFAGGIEIAGNLSVSAAFVYCTADVVSVIFAFVVSVVTMAINWRIRGNPSEPQIISELLTTGHCRGIVNPTFDNCILPNIHQGTFLDINTTVVTIFGMLFSFTLCGYFQCVSKYGKLAWLLNSLYTIIVFPFNNLMPVWRPWYYARNCVVPMCIAFTARFAVSLFLYPFSSNYKIVSSLSTATAKLLATCEKVRNLSLRSSPSDEDFSQKFSFINAETQSTFTKFIINEVDMEMVSYLEVWFSRFEKPDLSELQSQVRIIMSALSSFSFFFEAMASRFLEVELGSPVAHVREKQFKSEILRKHRFTPKFLQSKLEKTWKSTGAFESRRRLEYFKTNGEEDCSDLHTILTAWNVTTVDELNAEFAVIIQTYEPLLQATCDLLKAISQWLELAGQVLPFWRRNTRQKLTERCEEINRLLDIQSTELATVKNSAVPKDQLFALHGYVCRHFARRVRHLARWCILIQNQRPSPILVWPKKNADNRIGRYIVDVGDVEHDGYNNVIDNSLRSTSTSFKPLSQVQARNPDSTPPRNFWHLLGRIVEKLQTVTYNGDFLFCVKRAVLTTATLTPYFVRPICAKAYRHWFLWVAVLTTYTVARQAVDGIYGFFAKLVFNFFGCLVGMVGWYISAGSGRGNPFGYATVTAFIWLYICFQRQYNKHFAPSTSVVYSCTVTLVLGNSWNAGHIGLEGVELGRGFSVAWIRFVTVLIGIAVSFLGTIFPYIYTAKKAVRIIIGNCLEHLGELQSTIANFGVQRYQISTTRIIAHSDVVTKAARAIITNLTSAETLRKRLVYEPPLSGIYPTHRYKLLIRYVREITLIYSLIYASLDEVEDTNRIPEVLELMGWTNPRLCSDVFSMLYMTCRALSDGQPLPSVTSGNLTEQYLFDSLRQHRARLQTECNHPENNEIIMTSIALSFEIYERLDVIVMLIKELVGEVYDVNLDIFDLEKQASGSDT